MKKLALLLCILLLSAPAWAATVYDGLRVFDGNDRFESNGWSSRPDFSPLAMWHFGEGSTVGTSVEDPVDSGHYVYRMNTTDAKCVWMVEEMPVFDITQGVTLVAKIQAESGGSVGDSAKTLAFGQPQPTDASPTNDTTNEVTVGNDATYGQFANLETRNAGNPSWVGVSAGYHVYRMTCTRESNGQKHWKVYIDENSTPTFEYDGGSGGSNKWYGPMFGTNKKGYTTRFDYVVFDPTGAYAPGTKVLIYDGPKCNVSGTDATITWTTDVTSDSTVYYGTDPNNLTSNQSDPALVTSHSIGLSGLTTNQTWYYKVVSAKSGWTSADSGLRSMNVVAVLGPTVNLIEDPTQVRMEWRTDYPADGAVYYGTDPGNLDLNVTHADLRQFHSMPIASLIAGKTYYYKVVSSDSGSDPDHFPLQTLVNSFDTLPASTSYDLYDVDDGGKWSDYNHQGLPGYQGFSQRFDPELSLPESHRPPLDGAYYAVGFRMWYRAGFKLRVKLFKWDTSWGTTTGKEPINTWTVSRIGHHGSKRYEWILLDLRTGDTPTYPQWIDSQYLLVAQVHDEETRYGATLIGNLRTTAQDGTTQNQAFDAIGNAKDDREYQIRLVVPEAPFTPCQTIDGTKKVGKNCPVSLNDAIVSAAFITEAGGGLYKPLAFAIEEVDKTVGSTTVYGRFSGIRVISNKADLLPGDKVDIKGSTTMVDGERVISADTVTEEATPGAAPDPFSMANIDTGGGDYGYQGAVVNDATASTPAMCRGMNNVGILMKLRGKVTARVGTGVFADYIYVDDAYGLQNEEWDYETGLKDGSSTGSDLNIGIRCRPPAGPEGGPIYLPEVGDYVEVTGVMGVRKVNNINTRYLWSMECSEPITTFEPYEYNYRVKWNLLSLPGQPKDPDPAVIFGSGDVIDGRLYRWYAPRQSMLLYDMFSPDMFGAMNISEGYWLKAAAADTISYDGFAALTDDRWISAPKGWKIMGMPFNHSSWWPDWRATDGTAMKTIYDASQYPGQANWMSSVGYFWDAAKQSMRSIGLEDDFPWTSQLDPWYGYWVKTFRHLGLVGPESSLPPE